MTKAGLAFIVYTVGGLAARQPLTPEDLWNWRSASDPRISPGGQWVVYAEGWNDRPGDAACANLWLVPAGGGSRRRITEGAWRDRSPRWSPDGRRLAWISERGATTAIRVARIDPYQETPLPGRTPLALAWSPDGSAIAFTARTAAATAPAPWAPPAILPWLWPRAAERTGIFVVSAAGSGAARQVSAEDFDARGEPAWMPDGQSILTAATDGAIYAVPVAGGAPRKLTGAEARSENPIPSPDGGKIAWLATAGRPQSYSVRKLYVMNADGTRARALSGSLDRDADRPQWSSDSRTVYFVADDRGATHVYAARRDGTVRQATNAAERLRGFSLAANGRAAAVRSTAAAPAEVVSFTVDVPSQPVRLAALNEALLAERDTGAVEEIHYGSEGRSIQAWLVKPPRFDTAKKYPLLLDIQDGPRKMYGAGFQARAQIYAARGFVVLCANPRGTPGYGEEFGNLLRSRYPGDDFDDLMRGVDFALAQGYIDPRRLLVTGGLLAAWTIGHTDRFRRAVARHAITDWIADVALAPGGRERAESWMGAMPWEDPGQYVTHSPIFFAQNFRTPTLVLAGDPDPESEELYFALRERKVETALVRLPGAGKPSRRILELETILGWLGK
ncbi:MAG: prolyl oligopeptidase family serine peptidase [Acidobacteriia bacterium]|nr:prolyl oligopeptidase family serine peptidase [Terriglobia bacterium]